MAGLTPTAEDEAGIFTPRGSRVSASSEGYPSGERPGEMTPAESERMLGGITPAVAAERAAAHLREGRPRPTKPDMLQWNTNRQRDCWRNMHLPGNWDSMVASAGGPGSQRAELRKFLEQWVLETYPDLGGAILDECLRNHGYQQVWEILLGN